MDGKHYSEKFYSQREATMQSARQIVSLLEKYIQPHSIVDVGCGLGEFLTAFEEAGVKEVLGIDGAWVDKRKLTISPDNFMTADLTRPLKLDRKFDLAISCEVAEHLNETVADTFVDSLAKLSDITLFSAAIPQQGGTYHVNEQWPEYWAQKFRNRGFVSIDCLRMRLWDNPQVRFWYKQNLLIFVKESQLEKYLALKQEYQAGASVLALVHPDIFGYYARNYRRFTRLIPRPVKWILRKTVGV
jgi:SAM-dependent methyltransferase